MLETERPTQESPKDVAWLQARVAELEGLVERLRAEAPGPTSDDSFRAEQKWRSVVDNPHDFVTIIDSQGIIRYINRAASGFDLEDIVGKASVYEYANPADHALIRETIRRVFQEGESGFYETHIPSMDQWFSTVVSPIKADDAVVAATLLSRDITARKSTERALRDSEERLGLALDATADGLWDWNLITGEVKFSPQWFKSLGYELGELQSHERSWKKLVHPDDAVELMEAVRAHLAGETDVCEVENRLLTKSGAWRYNLRRGRVVSRDENGRPLRMVGTDSDITEKALATIKLQAMQERNRRLVETSQDLIFEADVEGLGSAIDGLRNGVFTVDDLLSSGRPIVQIQLVYMSPVVERLLGYSPEEAVEIPFHQLMTPESFQLCQIELIKAIEVEASGGRAGPVTIDLDEIHKSGAIVHTETKCDFLRDDAGRPTGLTGVTRDITLHELASKKRRSREAELAHLSRLSTMGEMVAGIAHEINQPLFSMANFAQACTDVLSNIDHENSQRLIEWTQEISQQALRCGDIIRRLRKFVTKDQTDLSVTCLNEVIRESVALIGPDIRHSRISIESDLDETDPSVRGVAVQLQQVFVNLLRNAYEVTRESTERRCQIKISSTVLENSVRVTVQDNGPGIAEEHMAHLFEAFYTTRKRGMGMGLAISKSIIEAHHGRLWAESIVGQGSMFHTELPLAAKPMSAA